MATTTAKVGTATLVAATSVPDGLGAIAGTGFTITGLTRADDGTWWAANEGQANDTDGSYTPSLVHLSADLKTKLGEISVGSKTERSLQGLVYHDHELYVGSKSERLVKVYSDTGTYLRSIAPSDPSTSVNGVAYDTSLNAVIIAHDSGATNHLIEWHSATTGKLIKTITIANEPDHVFFQASGGSQGTLWYTYGDSGVGATGHVVKVDIASDTILETFALKTADAIEGIYVSGNQMWIANDAYYHNGNPALNRVLQYTLDSTTSTPANAAPTAVTLSNEVTSIVENSSVAGGIKVADIGVVDDGHGTNTLTLSGADAASFAIKTTSSGEHTLNYVGSSPDFESKASYSVIVNANDATLAGSATVHQNFTLTITDVNEGSTGGSGTTGGSGSTDGATASYEDATAGVKAYLMTPTKNTGDAHGANYVSITNLTGSAFDDTLSGDNHANILNGGNGNDILSGQGGADILNGGAGNDTLSGNGGNDRLEGGLGNDTLTGGSGGKDWFAYTSHSWGNDKITDFEDNVDLLDFRGSGMKVSDLSITQQGADVLVSTTDHSNSILIQHMQLAQITASDFLF